jgi:translocation and assembly module TamA
VLATLSIARTPERTVLAEPRVRALLTRAESEVGIALEPFGHYEATVRDSLFFDGRSWRVLLRVDPGPPVTLSASSVRVVGPGADDRAFQDALRRAPLEIGAPLSHGAYELQKTGLLSAAADRGYLDAAFDSAEVRVDRSARTASVVLLFRTGPRYALGSVTFLQDVLDPQLLQNLVPWQPGAPFDGSQLLALQSALTEGPYFSGVEVVPRRDLAENLVVPIHVGLTPARPQRYSVGAGYGSDTGPRVTLNAEWRRLNRRGHRAELDGWVAAVERRATARYSVPLRARRASLLTLSGGYVDSNPTTSDTETWLIGAGITGLWGGWRGEVNASLQRSDFVVGLDSGITTLLLLGTGISRIRADDRVDPTHGSLMRMRVRGAHDAVIGDVRLFDTGAEARIVRTVAPRVRFRARGEIAALFTSDFSRLPGSIRYFAGGDRSVRGFGYQEIGPRDAAGNVIGGRRLLVGSVELELRVLDTWGIAAFADGGNAFSSFSDPLETGVGGGIRWRSPFGMVRLDGAFAVSVSDAPFRAHLNLGPEL